MHLNYSLENIWISLAMRRSGHHAILNQLCHQMGHLLHLNHCRYHNKYGCFTPVAGRFRLYNNGEVIDSGAQGVPLFRQTLAGLPVVSTLLYSFEDTDVRGDYKLSLEPHKNLTFVCIVRDPFNWLASVLQRGFNMRKDPTARAKLWEDCAELITLWKQHVEICRLPDRFTQGRMVGINYNRWVVDQAYRRLISEQLGLTFDDSHRDEVLGIGDGSSFDGTLHDGHAGRMSVLERWKVFAADDRYRALLRDPDVLRLSETYFQFNPFEMR